MHTRLRYWARWLAAFTVRFRTILFVGLIMGLLLFAALSFIVPRVFSQNTEYIGVIGRYHTDSLPSRVQSMIGEGLTAISESGEAAPALAERWEVSPDGTEWTFYLNKNKLWHDGTRVTAEHIRYAFEDAEFSVLDPYTVRFKLGSPFTPFPTVLSRPTFKKGLLGTGEWRVVNLTLNASYVEELVLRNHGGARKVLKFYPSEEAVRIAFQLGKVDIIWDLLEPSPFNSWNGIGIEEALRRDRIVAIFFNTESDIFKGIENKSIRQALSYAIDKDSLGGPRALGPVSPDSWAYNPGVKDYAYDEARAKELLADFGELNVSLTTTPTLLPVAEKVAEYWGRVGVTTNVQVVSALPEEYEAFLAIYDMPKDPDQYAIWHSTQEGTNVSKFKNPRIDKLLEDGRVTLDFDERKKIYLDFQRFLLEDAPAVFLYHPVSYTVKRK